MKTVTRETTKGMFMFVEVPDNSFDVKPAYFHDRTELLYHNGERGTHYFIPIHDTRKEITIIGQLSKITEDQAREVVDETDNPFWYGQGLKYIDYTVDDNCLEAAFNSIQSLIKSEGLDPAKDYVILKINKPTPPITEG